MLNQFEASDLLLHDVPELSQSLQSHNNAVSIYQTVRAFVQFTCATVNAHNYKAARQCFALADKLYECGNETVRSAIENVFVFSLDSIFCNARKEGLEVRGLVPGSLYSVYMRQVLHQGC